MESVNQNSENIKDEAVNELARLVIHRYTSLQSKYKVQEAEWTVLAGIVALNLATKEQFVVCVATGTKCLADATSVNGYLVRDCHAETLCRRALIRVLLDDIEFIQNDKSEKAKLLERDETKVGNLIRLKQNMTLNLIISDSPCGCASDFPRLIAGNEGLDSKSLTKPFSIVELEEDEKGCAEDKQSQLGNPRISGAKRLQLEKADDDDDLRTKPGRSDLPLERRTRSMSCADKLMRWQHLGLQGSLLTLLKLEEPIRYHSIILLRDAAMTCVDGDATTSNPEEVLKKASEIVLHALERSFARDVSLSPHHLPHLFVADQVGFSNSRQQKCPAQFGREKSHSAGKATWWAVNGEQESLTGVRGVKEGASKTANPALVCSNLCKARLLARVVQLLNVDQEQEDHQKKSYREWKERATNYRSNVHVFRNRFKSWNGNERYDEFSL